MSDNQSNLQTGQDDRNANKQPGKPLEGQPMGGHNFGNEGKATPTGDDKDNPSQNAGYSNAYFARTEPSDEDTANNNFKAAHQEGEPDYDQAHGGTPATQETAGQQKVNNDNEDQEVWERPGGDNSHEDQEHIEV